MRLIHWIVIGDRMIMTKSASSSSMTSSSIGRQRVVSRFFVSFVVMMLLIDSIHSFSLLLKPCSRIGRPTTSCCFLSADHDNDDRSNDNCKDENEPRQQPSDSIILNNNDIIGNEASQAAANILSSMQEDENKNGDDKSACTTTTLRINDHGSDLTNRFKYKVNALMGNFDPINDSKDTENENGNIYNAILTFPVMHTFHVIGKTNQNDAVIQQFQKDIHDIIYTTVSSSSRVTANNEIVVSVTPRGSKYTKITVQANVENASMISSIYEQLQLLELSIMQF